MFRKMMVRRNYAMAAAFILLLVIPVFVAGVTTGLLLKPTGRIRISLTADGGGTAEWNPEFPAVFDGSYSARFDSTAGGGGAGIQIGPLPAIPLSQLTATSVSFWVYVFGCSVNPYSPNLPTPYVEFVLDNGITMEGNGQIPASESIAGVLLEDGSAPPPAPVDADSEDDRGFASSELWTLMRPRTTGPGFGWFSSMAGPDPRMGPAPGGAPTFVDFSVPRPFSLWQAQFPTAKVVSIKVQFGFEDHACTVFVDNVTVKNVFGITTVYLIEPESVSSEPSTGKPFA